MDIDNILTTISINSQIILRICSSASQSNV